MHAENVVSACIFYKLGWARGEGVDIIRLYFA